MQNATHVNLDELQTLRVRCKSPKCSGVIEVPLESASQIGQCKSDEDKTVVCRFCHQPWFRPGENNKLSNPIHAMAEAILAAQKAGPIFVDFVIPCLKAATSP